MLCQPYITVNEFKASPFFCSFPECCIPTGMTIDDVLGLVITSAQSLINSYLGWEICLLDRTDIFSGSDERSYFTEFAPVDTTNGYTMNIRHNNMMYANPTSETLDQTTPFLRFADVRTGWFKFDRGFRYDDEYTLTYKAGYSVIPDEIKTAMYMLVLNLAQRLDNMALTNPDMTVDSINVDKSVVTNYGSARIIKNVTVKSIDELNDLPVVIKKILDRFKINKFS